MSHTPDEGLALPGDATGAEDAPSSDSADAVLGALAHDLMPPPRPATISPSTPARYELGAVLGQGGMGVVYRARDRLLNRDVAIKFLRRDDPALVERFLREARAQARVEHEHICRVYEVGDADGAPYICMQLVLGETLAKECSRMSLEEKVKVLATVALAVHAAHREGLIHRDLKPANILVARSENGAAHPYVMDFGLAQETQGPRLTATGQLLGTPHYMSPEQARGDNDAIDRRTDVYALGATLYELLTGEPPFRGASTAEVLAQVLSRDAPSARKRNPTIPADLETVTATCLAKLPGDRYDSARALAEDLQRYLDGEPISVRAPSLGYRLVKLVRRHPLAVAGAVLVVASLVAGTAVSLHEAGVAREGFEHIRKLAKSILFELHDEIQHLQGATRAREVLVRRALEYLELLAARVGDNPEVKLELAQAYLKIGDVQGAPVVPNLGRPADAVQSYERGLRLVRDAVAQDRGEATEVFAALQYRRALLRMMAGEYPVAIRHFESGLRAVEGSHDLPEPKRLELRFQGERQISQAYRIIGDVELALPHVERAVALGQAWMERQPTPGVRYWLGVAYGTRSFVLWQRGRVADAIADRREANGIYDGLMRAHPESLRYRRASAATWWMLGRYHFSVAHPSLADAAEARRWLARAIEFVDADSRKDPMDTRARCEAAIYREHLAQTFGPAEDAAAIGLLREAIAAWRRLPRTKLEEDATRCELGHLYGQAAMRLLRLGRAEEAKTQLLEASRWRKGLPVEGLDSGCWWESMETLRAEALAEEAQSPRAAEATLQRGLSIAKRLTERFPTNAIAHGVLADMLAALGAFHERQAARAGASRPPEACAWYAKEVAHWLAWQQRWGVGPFDARRLAAARAAGQRCRGAAR
jgi:tetratricopeptide (TPR) repeat protein